MNSPPATRPEPSDTDLPFVGRSAEYGRVMSAPDALLLVLVLVHGEAGVGKSRLLRETAAALARRGDHEVARALRAAYPDGRP